MRQLLLSWLFVLGIAACSPDQGAVQEDTLEAAPSLDASAEQYVKLALELGQYDKDYVDAYLGPEEWAQAARDNLRPEAELAAAIGALLEQLENTSPKDPEDQQRHRALTRNVRAMDTRMRMANGETFKFADEARLIYDVEFPDYDLAEFDQVLEEIDALIPGEGDLAERVDAFRGTFDIPADKIDAVFETTIAECRRRTAQYLTLPEGESFTLEYVNDKAWSGYNWYQGDNESLMQMNLDFPIKIDSAVHLGCHEGYPGHHAWNVLVENRLLKEQGWVERSIYPLFSPEALIGEGSANYGVELAFPGDKRTTYEREVLFPLAGLDPAGAEQLEQLNVLMEQLSHSTNEIARLYLDGEITRDEAIELRRKYGLVSPEKAEQRIRFIEKYRAYVVNYNLGKDIVKAYVESQADDQAGRWQAFERMLIGALSASDMITE